MMFSIYINNMWITSYLFTVFSTTIHLKFSSNNSNAWIVYTFSHEYNYKHFWMPRQSGNSSSPRYRIWCLGSFASTYGASSLRLPHEWFVLAAHSPWRIKGGRCDFDAIGWRSRSVRFHVWSDFAATSTRVVCARSAFAPTYGARSLRLRRDAVRGRGALAHVLSCEARAFCKLRDCGEARPTRTCDFAASRFQLSLSIGFYALMVHKWLRESLPPRQQ